MGAFATSALPLTPKRLALGEYFVDKISVRHLVQRAMDDPLGRSHRQARELRTHLLQGRFTLSLDLSACTLDYLLGLRACLGLLRLAIAFCGFAGLLEDLLDPDRNVDPAFATTTITTRDGAVITGIGVLEKGSNLEITDAEGKRRKISRSTVSSRKTSNLSLMSSALTRAIPEADFADLMQYLLEQK